MKQNCWSLLWRYLLFFYKQRKCFWFQLLCFCFSIFSLDELLTLQCIFVGYAMLKIFKFQGFDANDPENYVWKRMSCQYVFMYWTNADLISGNFTSLKCENLQRFVITEEWIKRSKAISTSRSCAGYFNVLLADLYDWKNGSAGMYCKEKLFWLSKRTQQNKLTCSAHWNG